MRRSRGWRRTCALPNLVLPGRAPSEVKGQAEFTRTPAEYLNAGYLASLAAQGRALRAKHAETLAKIEREIGVPGEVVLAIWGRESAFGSHRSPHYAIRALATQAWLGRRKEMFRSELIYALRMLQDGVRTRESMNASWAGAMGLTQFMPSEYYTLAYDLDGDGRKDIWTSVPTRWPRPPTSCAPGAGCRASRGASRCACPPAPPAASRGRGAPAACGSGWHSAWCGRGPGRSPTACSTPRPSCWRPAAPTVRRSWRWRTS